MVSKEVLFLMVGQNVFPWVKFFAVGKKQEMVAKEVKIG